MTNQPNLNTSLRLRDAFKANIKIICSSPNWGENEAKTEKYIINKIDDEFPNLIPIDFYLKIYNESVTIIKGL